MRVRAPPTALAFVRGGGKWVGRLLAAKSSPLFHTHLHPTHTHTHPHTPHTPPNSKPKQDQAFTYLESSGGLALEDDYPYEGVSGRCKLVAVEAVEGTEVRFGLYMCV